MTVLRPTRRRSAVVALSALLVLTACGGGSADTAGPASGSASGSASGPAQTTTVSTNLGDREVPADPVRVAALDNTSFQTLLDLGITPVAVPKGLLPRSGFEAWADDADIADAGNHREPVLEAISEAEPDLIIGGYRFQDYQGDLEKIATTIDIAPADDSEGGYVEGLKAQTTTLGEIFGKQDEAARLVAEFERAEQEAAAQTSGESVFLAVASGGRIDNGASRIGRIIEPLQLTNVLAAEGDSIHHDSGLAPETIAQLNPDWMIVMDRDAGTGESDATPARQLIAAQEAWENTTFVTRDHVVHLPPTFYVTEGIQAYTEVYDQIASAFRAA
ncbi:siderophore ABC transporter substrate-binding protein [Kineococcus sp. LSe6-4]|uniref:Siderophore ABC transporter substrate-binding protein n=1 Tax=Kineococcus halophytocola TaxID=3234027 RepID=A0ABV4H3C1_9ACTN